MTQSTTVEKGLDLLSSDLPAWDLTDLYSSIDAPEITADFASAAQDARQFATDFTGCFAQGKAWEPSLLCDAIRCYESLDEKLGRLISYGYLCYATGLNDPRVLQFFQSVREKVTNISSDMIFFTLEMNLIEDADLEKAYAANAELAHYKPWIESCRLFRPYQLSAEMERLLHEKSLTSHSAWVRLYDETINGIKFEMDNEIITLSEVLNHLSSKDPTKRATAARSLSAGLKSQLHISTFVTNTLAKDKAIEAEWRKYPTPMTSRHLSNQVEAEVVDALTTAVKAHYPKLSHRYYALKAKWLGKDRLEYWDRNSPLPHTDETQISWDDARDMVLNAYRNFCPKMADIGRLFFENNWIDVPPRLGKESGAFAHPTVPSAHPYLMLNFQGKLRDVMTLAHELGHGVHQFLANDQGILLSGTPLTVAETASVFGEMLTFKALLAKCQTKDERRSLMAAKVEDMLNTVVRQIAFYEFEKKVHMQRKDGELTSDQLGEIWMETQREALGDAVNLDPCIQPYWSYISHFIHAPFYVYAYAFGDCLVNSLYAVYESGHANFQDQYIELLRAGGSKRYPELLAPFGLDAKDPAFWEKGLSVVEKLIEDLERE